jgi:fused signal recognition particle receptor
LFSGDQLDEEIVDDVEEVLFTADIGPHVAQQILRAVEDGLTGEEKQDPARIWGFIRSYTAELLEAHEEPLALESAKPFVMLVVGVNGVGKTTTIGKMASKFRDQGKSVLLVAGDTFRAGAVDQLAIWADRTDMPIHQGEPEADPSSVLYAGIERGIKDDVDIILCDTSGRLHSNVNLMDELGKMARVAEKAMEGAPHETMLVLDANTGQNAIAQAKKFNEAVEVTGVALTKLDGTARGGVILGICDELEAPVRYIGIGESVVDLREFDADEFVEALFM